MHHHSCTPLASSSIHCANPPKTNQLISLRIQPSGMKFVLHTVYPSPSKQIISSQPASQHHKVTWSIITATSEIRDAYLYTPRQIRTTSTTIINILALRYIYEWYSFNWITFSNFPTPPPQFCKSTCCGSNASHKRNVY